MLFSRLIMGNKKRWDEMARYVSIWFRHLTTDWFALREPELKRGPFVLRAPVHGRMVVTGVNAAAELEGIGVGMALADARALMPTLEVRDDKGELPEKLLKKLAEWCIRFTPVVAVDLPHGLLLDVTGCPHLWGGEELYVKTITDKLVTRGYDVRIALADTPGVAWAMARYGKKGFIVPVGLHREALLSLRPEALRIDPQISERLHRLGLHQIGHLMRMPRPSLRRRFGAVFIQQLDMALGQAIELITPVQPVALYQERLPCLEPIVTLTGIEIALKELLTVLCLRLQQEQKGLRKATFKAYRVDGKTEQLTIGTNRPTHAVAHIFKLFEIKLATIEPALGIELFVLEAPTVDEYLPEQEKMWGEPGGLEDIRVSELVDRVMSKTGARSVHRYVPDEHYWPERSLKSAPLSEKRATEWPDTLRPLYLLRRPERIEVTAPIPDYPPMIFRYNNVVHTIVKADGPERIEQEWWLQQGQHRDYYRVEDEAGRRYWLFRLGHYQDTPYQWFLHGYFA